MSGGVSEEEIMDKIRSMTPEDLRQVIALPSGRDYFSLIRELIDFDRIKAVLDDPEIRADLVSLVESDRYSEFWLVLQTDLEDHLVGSASPFHSQENLNEYSGRVLRSLNDQKSRHEPRTEEEIRLQWVKAMMDPTRGW